MQFGSLITFDRLAGGDWTKLEWFFDLEWQAFQTKLYLDKEIADYERRLTRIRNMKRK